MNVEQVREFCAGLAGVTQKDYAAPSNILVYYVGGRKFAYFKTSEPERWRFSFRASPDRFLELTDQPGIKPARYMHRFHWVTIVQVAAVDKTYLEELICWSYDQAFSRLSKKTQLRLKQQESY